MSETPEPTTPSLPSENVPRGTLLALLIVPAGIIVWVVLWRVGFIASIVALGVAIGGMWLYRKGSGGRVSRTGAIRVTVITIVTLLLSFAAGIISDNPTYFLRAAESGKFFDALGYAISLDPGGFAVSFGLALVFGLLGCFSVLRTAFVQSRAIEGATPGSDVEPGTPGATPGTTGPTPDADKRD